MKLMSGNFLRGYAETRWGSQVDMFASLKDNKATVQQAALALRGKGYEMGQDLWWIWQDSWWKTIAMLADMLGPLRASLNIIQGDKFSVGQGAVLIHLLPFPFFCHSGVQLIVPMLPKLLDYCKQFAPADHRALLAIVNKRKEMLISPVGLVCALMDHRCRGTILTTEDRALALRSVQQVASQLGVRPPSLDAILSFMGERGPFERLSGPMFCVWAQDIVRKWTVILICSGRPYLGCMACLFVIPFHLTFPVSGCMLVGVRP